MKFISDLFGVILFFAAYSYTNDIFTATAVAIVATGCQVAYSWLRYRYVSPMQCISFGLVVIFGGATLWLKDKQFIMWKPTVLYGLLGIGLLVSQLIGRNGIRTIVGTQIKLPEKIWSSLCYAWAIFFLGLAGLNLFVAYQFSEAIWVNFKLFGTLALVTVFAIGQGLVLSRYILEK